MKTYKFKIYGHEFETKVVRREDDFMVISVNGQEYKAYREQPKRSEIVRPKQKLDRPQPVHTEGSQKTAAPSEPKGAGVVKAPLPGLVLKIVKKAGDEVKAGELVMIMEAMKMENAISASTTGTIKEIAVKEGDSVLEGQVLVTIDKA